MTTDRTQAFREFRKHLQEREADNKKTRFEQNKDLPMIKVIDNWHIWKLNVLKHDKDTVDCNRRKIKQLFVEIDIDLESTTLQELIDQFDGVEGLKSIILELREFHKERIKDSSIPNNDKLKWNSIAALFASVNPFFRSYLGLEMKFPSMSKKESNFQRVKLSDITKLLESCDNYWNIKIKLAKTDRKKQEYRKRWAVQRITIELLKYSWARTKAISENYLSLGDIRTMKKTGFLPLHIRKRLNNPEQFQKPMILDEFIIEWNRYEKYRDSTDWSDSAPAIVQVNSNGRPITRKWIRKIFRDLRRDAGLPDNITAHNIRRSMNTLASSVMGNSKVADLQLGDKDPKVIKTHYNIPDATMRKMELEKLYNSDDQVPGETLTPMETKKTNNFEEDMAYV